MRRLVRVLLIIAPAFILSIILKDTSWIIVYPTALAALSLSKVIINALNFNDCQKAAESLKEEIIEAKIDLTKRKFKLYT